MESLREGRGLFISGATGTGKTHLAVATCAAFVVELPPVMVNGSPLLRDVSFAFLPSVEYTIELKAAFGKEDGEEAVLRKYASPAILLLDDVGAEKISDWSRQMFYALIDRRYRLMKTTVITSNLNLGQLAEAIDDRISSRIAEMCEVLHLNGKDFRINKHG